MDGLLQQMLSRMWEGQPCLLLQQKMRHRSARDTVGNMRSESPTIGGRRVPNDSLATVTITGDYLAMSLALQVKPTTVVPHFPKLLLLLGA